MFSVFFIGRLHSIVCTTDCVRDMADFWGDLEDMISTHFLPSTHWWVWSVSKISGKWGLATELGKSLL